MAKSSNFPFYNWVPRWLGIIIHLLLFIPTFFVNGAYTSNASEMAGSLGIISENIQYASFATAVGMTVFTPFVIRYLILRRPKMSYLFSFSGLFVLSLVCAVTDSMFLLVLCSFFAGLFRIMLVFNTIFSLVQYLTHSDPVANYIPETAPTDLGFIDKLDRMKAFTMVFLYFYFLFLSQLCSSVTAWLAYEYEWQYAYYGMMVLTLFTLILVQTTMRYQKRKIKREHIRFTRLGDFVAASIFLAGLCYILIYGKTYDWFDNDTIKLALAAVLVAMGLFVLIQVNSKTTYLDFSIFKRGYTWIGLTVFLLLMMVNSHSALISAYTNIAMTIDNLHRADLNSYGLIGYVIGGILCFILFKFNCHIRYIFAIGFGCIGISAFYLYFYFQPEGLYSDLKFPTIIRCVGMDILYATGAIYGMKRLSPKLFPSWVFVMLAIRSVLAPVTGASLYSNLINNRSEQHLSAMMDYADESNIDFAQSYKANVRKGLFTGKGSTEANMLATTIAKGQLQKQAMLVTLKEIAGWTVYACMGCLVLILVIPYPRKE